MRRGINNRKRRKIMLNEINTKSLKLLAILIIILIICFAIYCFFIQNIFIKKEFEYDNIDFSAMNENVPFSIKKMILFTSSTAEADSVNQLLSLDISQYCDIGIYINELENDSLSISSLYIDNISISTPEIGTPCLYKKTVTDLGKCSFNENNIISDRFDFNVVNIENTLNYDNYDIYSNATTPISLGFFNKNIKTDFLSSNSEILYNGTLLKDAAIPISSLNCNVAFTINIITNTNEHYICNVTFDIPFEDENGSIYDNGYVTKEFKSSETNKFIRIK